MVGLLSLAFVGPRLAVLPGVRFTSPLSFIDMSEHLYNLDLVTKRTLLPAKQLSDPYLRATPQMLQTRFSQKWPPGTYYAALPWAAWFGPLSIWTTLLNNLLFLLIILFSMVGLGRALGSPLAGWLGALLVVLCPPLIASSWYFSLDFPVTAMVGLGLYLLWRTDRFVRPGWCAALVAWSGLGVWIKPTYPLYLAVPAVVLLAAGLWRGQRLRRVGLALGSAAAAGGLSFALLGVSWAKLWEQVTDHSVLTLLPGSAIDPWTVEWLLSNAKFAAYNYPWPLLLPVLPGVVLLAVRGRAPAAGRALLLATLVGGYALLTLMINKGERYMQPLYPLFCLLTAWWMVAYLPKIIGRILFGVVVAGYMAVLVVAHGYPTPWLPELELEAQWKCKPSSPIDCLPWRNNAAHPFWYEQTMPGKLHLSNLSAGAVDIFCDYEPVIKKVAAWERALPDDRPMAVAYLRDPQQEPGELPYAWLVALTSQWVRDRFVFAPGVAGLPVLPRSILDAPHLVVLHVPQVNPAARHPELVVNKTERFTMKCGPGTVDIALSFCQPKSGP